MCSYEKAGWSGYRDLATEASGKFFPYEHSSPDTGTVRAKHFQLHMACNVANKSERGSRSILGAFWTFFTSVTGIKFPLWAEDKIPSAYPAHMERP